MFSRFCSLLHNLEPVAFLYSTTTLSAMLFSAQQVSAIITYSTRYCACTQIDSAKDSKITTMTCFILLVEHTLNDAGTGYGLSDSKIPWLKGMEEVIIILF